MKLKGKCTLTPKLRFPEFRDEPGWEEKTGDSLFDQVNDRKPAPGLPVLAITQEHGAIPRNMIDYHVTVTDKSIESYKVVQVGDFIISLRSFQGGIEYSRYHGICSPAYVILRRRTEGSDAYFKHYLKTDRFIRVFTRNLEGLRDGKMISYKQFSELLLTVPSPPEQQKIANCLGSLDGLIAAEGRQLAALRDHKRGLMQQLFPQPGQTQPRLRFPEFRDKGGWEIKPLGKIAEIKLGKMLDKNKHRSGRFLPYLNNLSVRWNDFDISNLPKMYFNENELEKYELKKGDVIVCEGGEPGRSAVWDERLPNLKFQKALHRVRFKIQFVPYLLVHYLETIAGTSAFESLFTGGGIKHLTRESFAHLAIPIASPAEQHRIAACLSAIDTQITAQVRNIEALKQHKRGLMQQIFPAPEVF